MEELGVQGFLARGAENAICDEYSVLMKTLYL